jgi:hypothetical protein
VRQLPPRAQGFIAAAILAGACICGGTVAAATRLVQAGPWDGGNWIQLGCLTVFVAYLSHLRTPLPTGNGWQAMGTVGHMAALIILPLPLALSVIFAGQLLQQTYARRGMIKAVFNVSMTMLTVGVAGSVLAAFGGPSALFAIGRLTPLSLVAVCLASIAYYVNSPLYAVFFAYLHQRRVTYTFRVNYRSSVTPETIAIFIGVIAGFLWRTYPPLLALISMPVMITHFSYQNIRRLQSETIAAVKALAESIDVRDPYTARHSVNVAAMSRRLALSLGLSDDTVEQIDLAAQVHDLGKMTVPVEILSKNGALTPEERAIIEQHPETGAAVLSRYKGFGTSVPIVRHHHEWWDGRGYPAQLAGTAIPLGARIVALADTFDAMTSDRPYRKGLSLAQALMRIREGAGTQFDPALTDHFLRMLSTDHPDDVADTSALAESPPHAPAEPSVVGAAHTASSAAVSLVPMADPKIGFARRSLFPTAAIVTRPPARPPQVER